MPRTLWIVAELFGIEVTLFSPKVCVTCFPLTKAPISDNPTHINLVWVNKNHFALVCTNKDSPIPSVIYQWFQLRNAEAQTWVNFYKNRLEAGRKLFIKDLEEIVYLD